MKRIDEHTETTLVRVATGQQVPAEEVEHAARQLIAAWTDPSNPDNWLKRPATRHCSHCGKPFKTRMKLLASSQYCGDGCRQAAIEQYEKLTGHKLKEKTS